jgi:putative ABC transport system substrate-binding protein
MRRREFMALLGGSLFGCPLLARAVTQPLVGFLNPRTAAKGQSVAGAFREGLAETGFREGGNVVVEYRWAQDQYDRLPMLAAGMVERHVSVIVAGGTPSAFAAKAATKTIPIVFTSGLDPVRIGLVDSLSRPEANLTGATFYSGVLVAKQLEMLRELLPKAAVIAMLLNPSSPSAEPQMRDVVTAARANDVALHIVKVTEVGDFEAVFANLARLKVDGLLMAVDPFFDSRPEQLVELSARYRVPTIYYLREFVAAGGLLCYGGSINETYRQAGVYAGRILKGATPAELPVVQPARFDLVVNLKAAKALGLAVPTPILLRADEVIE